MFLLTNKFSYFLLNFSSPEFLIRSSFNLLGLYSCSGKLYFVVCLFCLCFGGFLWFGLVFFVVDDDDLFVGCFDFYFVLVCL